MKSKKEEKADVTVESKKKEEISAILKDAEARVAKAKAEAEKKVEEAEKKAVEKVCKVLEINPEKLKRIEDAKKGPKELKEYEIPFEVRINGKLYPCIGKAEASLVDGLVDMAAKKRNRLIRENIREENEIHMLANGQITSRVVKRLNAAGQSISE